MSDRETDAHRLERLSPPHLWPADHEWVKRLLARAARWKKAAKQAALLRCSVAELRGKVAELEASLREQVGRAEAAESREVAVSVGLRHPEPCISCGVNTMGRMGDVVTCEECYRSGKLAEALRRPL